MKTGALLTGFFAGVMSGIIGIGGGVIMIPCLVIFLGFSQHMAQGSTLAAMIPPIGILAAYEYYKGGYVDITAAGFIAIGFVLGGFLGAKFAVSLDEAVLRRVFGIVLLVISLRMIVKG